MQRKFWKVDFPLAPQPSDPTTGAQKYAKIMILESWVILVQGIGYPKIW